MRRTSGASFNSEQSETSTTDISPSNSGTNNPNPDRRSSLLSATLNSSGAKDIGSFNNTLGSSGASLPTIPKTPKRSTFFKRPENPLQLSNKRQRLGSISSPVVKDELAGDAAKVIPGVGPSRVVTGFRATTIPEYKGHMPRCGHTAITYKRDFYIFGGVNNKNQYPNYIYCHEKRSLQWEEIRGVGVVPTGRANHSAVVHKNKMIIYGGHRYLDVFDDLYSYDLDARRWDKIGYEKRQGPGPVFLHAAVYIPPTQTMAIIGGFHQREYNMYLGHIFDIRNRTWSGIPGPQAINLQHLQLVTATFDAKSTSIVVLGLTEAKTAFGSQMPSSYVYLMNIHSFIWTKVETSSSPESPIPFRMDVIWEKFMREFITMGGFHDSVMHSWFFPINIESVIDARGSQTSMPTLNTRGGRARYGFFKLQLDDMKWSIVPTSIPKKLMAELAQKNRDSMLQKKTVTTNISASSSRTQRPASSKGMLHNMNASVQEESGLIQIPSAVEITPQKKAMLFSVDGDPQFQRKYAYAANRDGGGGNSSRKKSSKSMQYLVMHGGLDPGMDYTMLMFTPQLSRTDAFTSTRLEGDDLESSAISRSGRWSDDDEEPVTRSVLGMAKGRRRLFENSTTFQIEDSKDEMRSEDAYAEGAKERCLLPTLPCTQNRANLHRFAVLFHANNSLQKEELLPYPTTPAAILEANKDIEQWAERYYADTRKWLADKLSGVVQEDRQIRRLQKKQQHRASVLALQDLGSDDDSSSSEEISPTALQKLKPEKPSSQQEHNREAFTTRRMHAESSDVQTDFFAKRNLHLFGLEDFKKKEEKRKLAPTRNASVEGGDVSSSGIPSGFDRLNMKVKRHQEQQRLPSAIFSGEGETGAITGDLGSAMAFVLMQNALNDIPQVTKEDRSRRAMIRWRFLRALVRTGEAAFVIYRVSQEEAKMKGLGVTSNAGLLLAPELHLIGPTRSYKVSSRPIPYTVPQNAPEMMQFAEFTSTGMVVYHLGHF